MDLRSNSSSRRRVAEKTAIAWRLLAILAMFLFLPNVWATALMEEGFNYLAGSSLGANPPWSGTRSSSLGIVAGNLTLSTVRATQPPGGMLRLGGTAAAVYRNFSSTPITGGAVYYSALINCTVLPQSTQFITSLMTGGSIASSQPGDPLDLYFITATNGYRLRIRHAGGDSATAQKTLSPSTTHFIVLKYTFGGGGRCSLYIDPTGATEPTSPDAMTQVDDDGGGVDPPNLQVVLLNAASSGSWTFDTLRIGTNWVDAVPAPQPLAQFYACGALPGFFSGMNLFTTNLGSMTIYAWSSSDPGLSITNWTLEGQLAEQPLNDGTSNSRYAISVNPTVSPVYYILGQTTSGLYSSPVPVEWITTDSLGNYGFFTTNVTISASGVLGLPGGPPSLTQQPVSQSVLAGNAANFAVAATGSGPLSYQWYLNTNTPLATATNAGLTLVGVTPANAGNYNIVVANAFGSVTSSVATLTVVLPPLRLQGQAVANGFQLSADAIAGSSYWVQAAASLNPPVSWVTVATNVAGPDGMVLFTDTNTAANPSQFYRLVSP
jgi:Immunoglobulin I-set domain